MKSISLFLPVALLIGIVSCSKKLTIEDIQPFAATESYPDDQFLDTVSNKRALIIVAHDDDDCMMSGTVSRLTEAGWTIRQYSFGSTPLQEGHSEHPATIICEGNYSILSQPEYRLGLDTVEYPYVPFPREQMEEAFSGLI